MINFNCCAIKSEKTCEVLKDVIWFIVTYRHNFYTSVSSSALLSVFTVSVCQDGACANVCYVQRMCAYVRLHVCNPEMWEEFGEKGLKICEERGRGAGTQLETDWLPAWGGNKNLLSSPVWDLCDQAQDVRRHPRGPAGISPTLLRSRSIYLIVLLTQNTTQSFKEIFPSLGFWRGPCGWGSLKINTVLLDGADT